MVHERVAVSLPTETGTIVSKFLGFGGRIEFVPFEKGRQIGHLVRFGLVVVRVFRDWTVRELEVWVPKVHVKERPGHVASDHGGGLEDAHVKQRRIRCALELGGNPTGVVVAALVEIPVVADRVDPPVRREQVVNVREVFPGVSHPVGLWPDVFPVPGGRGSLGFGGNVLVGINQANRVGAVPAVEILEGLPDVVRVAVGVGQSPLVRGL